MDAWKIKQEAEHLKMSGETSYENCERLVILEKALKYMENTSHDPASDCSGDSRSMTSQEAESWVGRMQNADGSVGAHWTPDQTEMARKQRGIDCDPHKFWVAMNMMYSDYCKVAKQHNVCTAEFFSDMAKAFLSDADAMPDKLALYYRHVAAHHS